MLSFGCSSIIYTIFLNRKCLFPYSRYVHFCILSTSTLYTMKNLEIIFSLLLLGMMACQPSPNTAKKAHTPKDSLAYDSALAAKYGADAYGMKTYVMAFLKRGPNRSQDSATAARLQLAHLENIMRMAEEGKLVVAGPFLDSGDIRGIYIFNVATVEEARALTATDPAIKAGSLEMELKTWYGSAALQMLNEMHERLQQKKITD